MEFTLGYGDDGRTAAAREIKKSLQSGPSQRDTMQTLAKNYAGVQSKSQPSGAFFRKSSKVAAIANAVDRALRKIALPPQSSNAASTNVLPDTGGRNVRVQRVGENDVVPKPDNGANGDAVMDAIKRDLSNPKRMFGR